METRMYVCICHCVTDRQIREAAHNGASRLKHLRDQLKVAATCGKCAPCAREMLRETQAIHSNPVAGLAAGLGTAFA